MASNTPLAGVKMPAVFCISSKFIMRVKQTGISTIMFIIRAAVIISLNLILCFGRCFYNYFNNQNCLKWLTKDNCAFIRLATIWSFLSQFDLGKALLKKVINLIIIPVSMIVWVKMDKVHFKMLSNEPYEIKFSGIMPLSR